MILQLIKDKNQNNNHKNCENPRNPQNLSHDHHYDNNYECLEYTLPPNTEKGLL